MIPPQSLLLQLSLKRGGVGVVVYVRCGFLGGAFGFWVGGAVWDRGGTKREEAGGGAAGAPGGWVGGS
jgi:hypothetical protein